MKLKLLINYLVILLILVFGCKSTSFAEDIGSEYNPKPASASVYNLGLKSYEQGDTESAVTFFKRSVDLDPGFVDAYFNLGAIYKKQKNYTEAIAVFQKAVEINSHDLEATYELASCYFEVKNYIKARSYFSLIPNNFSKYAEARQNIEKINSYLSTSTSAGSGSTQDIQQQNNTQETAPLLPSAPSAPAAPVVKNQNQLFADTLTLLENQRNKETLAPAPSQAPAKTLTKPTKELLKGKFRVVTSNFDGPAGIAKDSKGNLYIANFTKNIIERISPDGSREVFLDKYGLSGPVGLATDENDNLYIANYNGDSILRVTKDKVISVLLDKIVRPYYLFYDSSRGKLFATVQGNDSLIEIDTQNISDKPITSR